MQLDHESSSSVQTWTLGFTALGTCVRFKFTVRTLITLAVRNLGIKIMHSSSDEPTDILFQSLIWLWLLGIRKGLADYVRFMSSKL